MCIPAGWSRRSGRNCRSRIGYHFVCPKGHETRPKVRAFRDWLFAEMAETKEKWGALSPGPEGKNPVRTGTSKTRQGKEFAR